MDRRAFLQSMGSAALAGAGGTAKLALGATPQEEQLPFANGERPLVRYPGKRPLIQLTARPPQLETPFSVFDEGPLTPNDAFFVRYHLSGIPLSIDPDAFRLTVKGEVERPLSLSLTDLAQGFDPCEIVAVNQCSGNSRGFFEPRVAGGQLGHGAMGNARWRGVTLKSVLDAAGVKPGARQVTFKGLDRPALPETPVFEKALDIDHARDGEVMLAWSMNGEDLPWLNGYPLRLVTPGYYGTYWVKHLAEVTVVREPFEGYWMKKAYRVPDNDCACVAPGSVPQRTVPISRFNVRSLFTNVSEGSEIEAAKPQLLRGLAFDGGYGVTDVLVSTDSGLNWRAARLGADPGRYSFRPWSIEVNLPPGEHELKVRAINRIGETQPMTALWNPAGYRYNAVETLRIAARAEGTRR